MLLHSRIQILIFMFFAILPSTLFSVSDQCKRWFEKSKIDSQAKDCEMRCALASVDMGTFDCPGSCKDLCGEEKYLQKMIGSGLCRNEIIMAALNPDIMQRANELSMEATKKTKQVFGRNGWKDESDAFRHYYWSALLTKEFDAPSAQSITDAHESCSGDNLDSTMDKHNNALGINTASALQNKGILTEENILTEAKNAFREKKFDVINPTENFSSDEQNWSNR